MPQVISSFQACQEGCLAAYPVAFPLRLLGTQALGSRIRTGPVKITQTPILLVEAPYFFATAFTHCASLLVSSHALFVILAIPKPVLRAEDAGSRIPPQQESAGWAGSVQSGVVVHCGRLLLHMLGQTTQEVPQICTTVGHVQTKTPKTTKDHDTQEAHIF